MSEDIRVTGTLKPVLTCEGENVDILDYLYLAYNFSVSADIEEPEVKFSIFEEILEEEDIENDYFLIEGKLYKLHDKKYEEQHHCKLYHTGTGVDFDVSYYSSCSLKEILQDELNKER